MTFYTAPQRELQARFDTTALADRLEQTIVVDRMDQAHTDFIQSRDFFFLSTVDSTGMPTVSYKGGAIGLVTAVNDQTLAFPSYDGNGMHLSMGNVLDTGRVGLLFIDFETPRRVRIQGSASIDENDPMLRDYPGAKLIVRVAVEQAFRNCARYIHKQTRAESSAHVPDADGSQPLALWKRIETVQDVLPTEVNDAVESAGGSITAEEYGRRMIAGES
jgi:predicted pyridoxine 5'-phosphate oxidase superfamily flavin-nucleotide-binding protein